MPATAGNPNDPWPRWVEIAADHWWLEAEIEGAWTGLDPAFPGSQPGEVRGQLLEVLDDVPAELVARFRVEILHSDLLMTGSEMSSGQLIGSNIEMFIDSSAESGFFAASTSRSPPVPPWFSRERMAPARRPCYAWSLRCCAPRRERDRFAVTLWQARVTGFVST